MVTYLKCQMCGSAIRATDCVVTRQVTMMPDGAVAVSCCRCACLHALRYPRSSKQVSRISTASQPDPTCLVEGRPHNCSQGKMLLRAVQPCRTAAQPAPCVRAHQHKHTRSPCQAASRHRPYSVAHDHPHARKVVCGSSLLGGYIDTEALQLQPPTSWVATKPSEVTLKAKEGDKARLEIHHVHTRLPLKCVALGMNDTYVISYEDGDMAWSAGLARVLCKDLDSIHRDLEKITAIALGRDSNTGGDSSTSVDQAGEVSFIVCTDTCGESLTYMGDGCAEDLRQLWLDPDRRTPEGCEYVQKVAFAPGGGHYVFTSAGDDIFEGLPASLMEAVERHADDEDGVQQVSVGHNGEWFVRFWSGLYRWEGVHPTLDRLLEEGRAGFRARRKGSRSCRVEWVELGPNSSFVAQFDDRTVWYGSEALTEQLLSCV